MTLLLCEGSGYNLQRSLQALNKVNLASYLSILTRFDVSTIKGYAIVVW